MADKKERQQYLKFRGMANDLRKAEHWDKLDGVLNRNKTVQNLYKMGYRKLSSDVVEVKHGYWKQSEYVNRLFYCSECGRHIEDGNKTPEEFFPYCHCGAKMDGGKTE